MPTIDAEAVAAAYRALGSGPRDIVTLVCHPDYWMALKAAPIPGPVPRYVLEFTNVWGEPDPARGLLLGYPVRVRLDPASKAPSFEIERRP
jgi:hypothetical protein